MLRDLAHKYETKEFLVGDPSWFMHQVEGETDKELLAFIASSLSYGSRKQFIPRIQLILDYSGGKVAEWLLSGQYDADIKATDECFYRLFSCRMMNRFFCALAQMVRQFGSIRGYVVASLGGSRNAIDAVEALTRWFVEHESHGIVPKDTKSSCKRVCMFLRWMVRDGSPVDIGLWADIIDKSTLIIPMDTHVVQEANRLGLTSSRSTSMGAALKLTEKLREVFPDDPVRADFALFGLGVDQS